jgi:hypothetical protein
MVGLRGYVLEMIDKRALKKAIGDPLQQAGFVNRGQSWYLDGKDAMVVATLESIRMPPGQYGINVGIWLKAFGEATLPAYNHCHLYYRLERLFPSQRDLVVSSCSLPNSNPQMLSALSDFVRTEGSPFLEECTDVVKLREFMSRGLLKGGFVRAEARSFLSDG